MKKEIYEINETIEIRIIPNVHYQVSYISFTNVNDNSDIITINTPSLINSNLL